MQGSTRRAAVRGRVGLADYTDFVWIGGRFGTFSLKRETHRRRIAGERRIAAHWHNASDGLPSRPSVDLTRGLGDEKEYPFIAVLPLVSIASYQAAC